MKAIPWLIFTIAAGLHISLESFSQLKESRNREIYFGAGTHLSFFSPSDIRLESDAGPGFDFTFYNVSGKDDGGINFSNGAPHYGYAVGFLNHMGQ